MSNNQTKTYLLTFNVNIYAETQGNQPQPMYDFNGNAVIQYMKGETLEISEESFIKFIEYGGMVNNTTTPHTGEPCRAHFTTECVDRVSEKTVWMQIQNYLNGTHEDTEGISGWASSFQAARKIDEHNGDSYRQDAWLKNQKEEDVHDWNEEPVKRDASTEYHTDQI
jgi:hypothetical protein